MWILIKQFKIFELITFIEHRILIWICMTHRIAQSYFIIIFKYACAHFTQGKPNLQDNKTALRTTIYIYSYTRFFCLIFKFLVRSNWRTKQQRCVMCAKSYRKYAVNFILKKKNLYFSDSVNWSITKMKDFSIVIWIWRLSFFWFLIQF